MPKTPLANPLRIFSAIRTNRTQFVFDLIFEQLLGISYERVNAPESAHIIYANGSDLGNSIFIPVCSNLLNATGTKPINVPFSQSGAATVLFPNEKLDQRAWAFDLFSAVFYLVSRYEEYEGFEPDAHGRFQPNQSILYKTNSFEFPLVNLWVRNLKQQLLARWPELEFDAPKFRFISTIDIDSTFQYKEKGFLWSMIGLCKDVFKGNITEVKARVRCIIGAEKDEFDIFDALNTLHKLHQTEVIYFFLLAKYSKFDKNISWKNKKQAERIKALNTNYKIGIHPSYRSNSNPKLLKIEMDRLTRIIGLKPTMSRQHFLMHKYPSTYQNLIKNGIKQDFTLGYTSQYGFRAGIASPFFFYDLTLETCTELMLYPFCSMDITPLHYYALTPEQAIAKNLELLQRVKMVDGTFISLWHNESLSGTSRWLGGWPLVYKALLNHTNEVGRS